MFKDTSATQILHPSSVKNIGLKEFKGSLETLYVPTGSTSGEGLAAVGMASLAFPLIAKSEVFTTKG